MDFQGSRAGSGSPFCSNSIECLSGERTKTICPSRGGRLMVMPACIRRSQIQRVRTAKQWKELIAQLEGQQAEQQSISGRHDKPR